MAATRAFRFGPGSLESLELRLWTKPSRRLTIGGPRRKGERYLGASLTGSYRVYAPSGEYRAEIAEQRSAWETDPGDEPRLMAAAREGDEAAARALAELLTEYALEDWTDPAEGVMT